MRSATRWSAASVAKDARANIAAAKTRSERNRFNGVCTIARTPQAKNYRSKGPAVRKRPLAGEGGQLGKFRPLGGERPPCRLGILGGAEVLEQEGVHDAVGKTPGGNTRLLELRHGCGRQGVEPRFPDASLRGHDRPSVGRCGRNLDRRARRLRPPLAPPHFLA